MNFAKWVFRISAVYGFLVLVPHYFMESFIGTSQPPAITHAEFFYGFVGAALACQIMFWIISGDPKKYRPLMIAAVFEKFSFFIPVVVLQFTRGFNPGLVGPACIDLIFGCLFLTAYAKTK